MTFERAVQIHGQFLSRMGGAQELAQPKILEFLGWEEPDEDAFARDVRIVLVSEDFGKELTTAVLWLRERDIDIRCIRLRPYKDAARTMVNVQQIIPLPEAQDYIVRLKEKEQEERRSRTSRGSPEIRDQHAEYWQGVLDCLSPAGILEENANPMRKQDMRFKVGWPDFYLKAYFSRTSPKGGVWLDCRGPDGIANYEALRAHQQEIEKAFGEPLVWQVNERGDQGSLSCWIKGFDSKDRGDWPRQHKMLADRVLRLYRAIALFVEPLCSGRGGV